MSGSSAERAQSLNPQEPQSIATGPQGLGLRRTKIPEPAQLRPELQNPNTYVALRSFINVLHSRYGKDVAGAFADCRDLIDESCPIAEALLTNFQELLLETDGIGAMGNTYPTQPAARSSHQDLQFRNQQRKNCSDQIVALTPGINIQRYAQDVREVLYDPNVTLSEREKISILKTKITCRCKPVQNNG